MRYCVWRPSDRVNDRSAVRRSHQFCHEPKQSLYGDCSTSSTQAFLFQWYSKSCPANKKITLSDSCITCTIKLNLHVERFSGEGQKDGIMSHRENNVIMQRNKGRGELQMIRKNLPVILGLTHTCKLKLCCMYY